MIRMICSMAALSLFGCATIVEGTSQEILVDSSPPGAQCRLESEGDTLAVIERTPQSVTLEKGNRNILVECAGGRAQGSQWLVPELNDAIFGSWMLGGIIGMSIDADSGAAYSWPESVLVVLEEMDR